MIKEALVIKELANFENPTDRVLAVEARGVELHMRLGGVGGWGEGVRRWLCRGRRVDGDRHKVLEHGIHFGVHGGLCLDKGNVVLGESGLALGQGGLDLG